MVRRGNCRPSPGVRSAGASDLGCFTRISQERLTQGPFGQAAPRMGSSCRSQPAIWFQLALVWSTNSLTQLGRWRPCPGSGGSASPVARLTARSRSGPPTLPNLCLSTTGDAASAPTQRRGLACRRSLNGLWIRIPAIDCPSFKSSVAIRRAPARAATAMISASQNPIRA